MIALFLTVAHALIEDGHMLQSFLINMLFSHFIGWSVSIPVQYIVNGKRYLGWAVKSILIFLSLLIFGMIGSQIAYFLIKYIFFPGIYFVQWRQLMLGNLALAIFFGLLGLFYFSMYHRLERTISALKEKEIEHERLKQLQKSAELESLRAKVDPHFLFNTLNSIASLIKIDTAAAEQMVEKLAALFRYTLQSGDHLLVPLAEEAEIIKSYLSIEMLRLGDRLRYEVDISEEAGKTLIPPLLIQPLVENAVRHGISPKVGGGLITVRGRKQDDTIILEVSDNGVGLNGDKVKNGFGLRSVRDRLRLIYGDRYTLRIQNQNGIVITIIIPQKL